MPKMKTKSGAAKRFKKTATGFKHKSAFTSHILTKKSPKRKRQLRARRRHKKILKQAKGYYGARSRVFRVAKQAVIKAGQYAYRDRRNRKRSFRALWIARINAGARANGLSYSRLIAGLKKANVEIDRKVLADLAMNEQQAFAAVVDTAKASL